MRDLYRRHVPWHIRSDLYELRARIRRALQGVGRSGADDSPAKCHGARLAQDAPTLVAAVTQARERHALSHVEFLRLTDAILSAVDRAQISLENLDAYASLVRGLAESGFLRASHVLRERLKSHAVIPSVARAKPSRAFQAALELGMTADLPSSCQAEVSPVSPVMAAVVALAAGRSPESTEHDGTTISVLRARCAERSIAMVGPAQSLTDQGPEIDSFDLIFRPNFLGATSIHDGSGRRNDISFYVPRVVNGRHLALPRIVARECRDVLALSPNGELVQAMRRHGVEAQKTLPMDDIVFQAGLNSFPKVAIHLALAGAARIKLFNIDLFISSRYPDGYRDQKSADPRSYCWMFSRMHPSAQFSVLKHFASVGMIECDERLSEILAMTLDDYIGQLESRYGRTMWR